MNWNSERQNDIFIKCLLFLVSPLLGLMASIKSINTKSSFVIFFLFSVLFGLNFTTVIGRDEFHTGDATVYRMHYERMKYFDNSEFASAIDDYLSFDNDNQRDIYVPIMSFVASRFSDNYHVFFMILAIVFSFFMLKSLRFLANEIGHINTIITFLILFMFVFRNGIFNINGCRFWTASWIGIYAVLQILFAGKKKYILLAAITPAVHASYWFFIAILLVYLLFGKNIRLWKVLFFVSFFVSGFSTAVISDLSQYLPASLQFLVERYTGEFVTQNNLYQIIRRIFNTAYLAYLAYFMFLFIKNEEYIMSDEKMAKLYKIVLVSLTIINFVMPIPSLGSRYFIVFMPLVALLWFIVFEERGMYRKVIMLFPIVSMFFVYERLVCYWQCSVPLSFYYTCPLYQIYKYLIVGVI